VPSDLQGPEGEQDIGLNEHRLRNGIVDSLEIFRRQLRFCGTKILFEAVQLRGPRNRYDPRPLPEQPRQRNLRLGRLLLVCNPASASTSAWFVFRAALELNEAAYLLGFEDPQFIRTCISLLGRNASQRSA
jgi:hypothetical protein